MDTVGLGQFPLLTTMYACPIASLNVVSGRMLALVRKRVPAIAPLMVALNALCASTMNLFIADTSRSFEDINLPTGIQPKERPFRFAPPLQLPYRLACRVRGAHCTVHSAQCTVHSAPCTVHSAPSCSPPRARACHRRRERSCTHGTCRASLAILDLCHGSSLAALSGATAATTQFCVPYIRPTCASTPGTPAYLGAAWDVACRQEERACAASAAVTLDGEALTAGKHRSRKASVSKNTPEPHHAASSTCTRRRPRWVCTICFDSRARRTHVRAGRSSNRCAMLASLLWPKRARSLPSFPSHHLLSPLCRRRRLSLSSPLAA